MYLAQSMCMLDASRSIYITNLLLVTVSYYGRFDISLLNILLNKPLNFLS